MKKLLVLILLFVPIVSYSNNKKWNKVWELDDAGIFGNVNNTNNDIKTKEIKEKKIDDIISDINVTNSHLKNTDKNPNSIGINDVINNISNSSIDNTAKNPNEDTIVDVSNDESQKNIVIYETIGEANKDRFVNTANIRFLDKITAKSVTKKIKIGEKEKFGKLVVLPLKCWKSYPEEMPENKLLIKVFEVDKNNNEKVIFYGWIFSSTPSISGIEHPMYDITLEDCNNLEYDNKLQGNSKTNKK